MADREAQALRMIFPVLLALAVSVKADVIWVAAGARESAISDVRIGEVKDSAISYEDSSGKRAARDISTVTRLEMDDEPALSAAERAFVQQKWAEAAEGYEKAIAGTRRTWVKAWMAPRLVESGENAANFHAAVVGYLELVRSNRERAERTVPSIPEEPAQQKALSEAAAEVKEMLAEPGLDPRQRQCLLSFLLDIHRARHDQPAADEVLDQMLKSGDAGAARAVVRRKLDEVARALEKEEWEQAETLIRAGQATFIDPRDQAEALYFQAEAARGRAADTSDATVLKDIALAYMRVVAHFKDVQGAPFVAASLLKTGAIEERIGDEAGARRIYNEVATDFRDGPAGAAARARLKHLQTRPPAKPDAGQSPAQRNRA